MTLAPELPGALPLTEKLAASGVCVAIGHTAADRRTILSAVEAGARLSTHLGNAAHDMLQRHHNYIYDQLGEDRLFASFIVDGHHLPPHLVQSFARAKGLTRSILVSDAVQYTGLPPGVYDGGYRKFEVRPDGFIGVVGEPRLAGSGIVLPRGIENLVRFAGVSLGDAIETVTANPADLLGLRGLGRLLPGQEASIVRFRWDEEGRISVRETVVAGKVVFVEAASARCGNRS
jgi:N-acetylglucosamine-6-phosphate deacetylase